MEGHLRWPKCWPLMPDGSWVRVAPLPWPTSRWRPRHTAGVGSVYASPCVPDWKLFVLNRTLLALFHEFVAMTEYV